MYLRLISNHVFANLMFVLTILMGTLSYTLMPREKDPTINFNWIQVMTFLPGASAEDIEKKITDPLEKAIRKIDDVRFVSSTSRQGLSSILLRFEEINEATFDKRLNDLRREVQTIENTELPERAQSPIFIEITTDNALPVASIVVSGVSDDENLRRHTILIEKDLERLKGVDNIVKVGDRDPELRVAFDIQKLSNYGLSPIAIAQTVRSYYQDIAAGGLDLGDEHWLIRLSGTSTQVDDLAKLPILGSKGEVLLGDVAQVQRQRAPPDQLVFMDGQAGVLLWVTKKTHANVLALVKRLKQYITQRNTLTEQTGITLTLIDDQTHSTRQSIHVMQTNAALGLLFVLLITWVFLGSRIAILTSIGIPFTLAGTFWFLDSIGHSVNNSVLLGVVISLGMLVDDAVVVVEAIFNRLRHGVPVAKAISDSWQEVATPVLTSVMTTMAAFLPLMLIPGILGKFMFVVPLVVTVALAVSLVEAFWILPAHVMASKVNFKNPSRFHIKRVQFIRYLQMQYGKTLIKALRYPKRTLLTAGIVFILAIGLLVSEQVKVRFFAFDPIRLFYVDVTMPQGSTLENTADMMKTIEQRLRSTLNKDEVRGIVAYAGELLTDTEPLFGDRFGQVTVSLLPQTGNLRGVEQLIEDIRPEFNDLAGLENIRFWALKDGPPAGKAIAVKVRGDDFTTLSQAVNQLKRGLAKIPGVSDINDDNSGGVNELALRLNLDSINRAQIDPSVIAKTLQLLVDGEIVTTFQDGGEEIEVRVVSQYKSITHINDLLAQQIVLPSGQRMSLSDLVHAKTRQSRDNIRHYNYRRAITIEAEVNKSIISTVEANQRLQAIWQTMQADYPTIDLDFSGELDDIQESINAISVLFLFGLGLIYLIVGTQFKSYLQPLIVIFATLPMAATGVILGLWLTNNPLSLFTLYGVVALGGIAVNASIVMISAANSRYQSGMNLAHSTFYAARRRFIPIIITALTTIGGLFSLATGLGGRSLLWGPVATAIASGLTVSTFFSLFLVPLFYYSLAKWTKLPWNLAFFSLLRQKINPDNV